MRQLQGFLLFCATFYVIIITAATITIATVVITTVNLGYILKYLPCTLKNAKYSLLWYFYAIISNFYSL